MFSVVSQYSKLTQPIQISNNLSFTNNVILSTPLCKSTIRTSLDYQFFMVIPGNKHFLSSFLPTLLFCKISGVKCQDSAFTQALLHLQFFSHSINSSNNSNIQTKITITQYSVQKSFYTVHLPLKRVIIPFLCNENVQHNHDSI